MDALSRFGVIINICMVFLYIHNKADSYYLLSDDFFYFPEILICKGFLWKQQNYKKLYGSLFFLPYSFMHRLFSRFSAIPSLSVREFLCLRHLDASRDEFS